VDLPPLVMVFDVNGSIQLPAGDRPAGFPQDPAAQMNGSADEMCERIEREIKKLLPPSFSAQAGMQFENGSLILSGTIAILSWGASILTDAVRKELCEQLSPLLRITIQRVVHRALSSHGMLQSVGTMSVTVTPQSFLLPPSSIPTSPSASLRDASSSAVVTSNRFVLLATATAIVFLVQIALVLDRFLVVGWRT